MLHPALYSPGGLFQFCRYKSLSPAGGQTCSSLPISFHLSSPPLPPATHAIIHPFNTRLPVFLPILGCKGRGQNFSTPARSVCPEEVG